MSWFAAGAIAVGTATSIWQGRQQAKAAARAENGQIAAASDAEARAIVRDRLNQRIRNSYQAAILQKNLALAKQKAAQTGGDISAAALAAKGTSEANRAASGNFGASAVAVASDIDAKAGAALEQNKLNLEADLENYNSELDAIVVNTQQSAPEGVRKYSTYGYSSSWKRQAGVDIITGLAQFGLGYAQRRMSLGPGVTPTRTRTTPDLRAGYIIPRG